jgi:hypothetical protein
MLVFLLLASWPAPDPNLEPEALSRPEQMPNDPLFAPGPDCTGQLELYSFTPACTPDVDRPGLGSGIHADRAWLLTLGRPEVTIAFIDSGADLSEPELVSRYRLNSGELPHPTGSAVHDANGDGAFTVLDYTTATGTTPPSIDRVSDATLLARTDRGDVNGNGVLDPSDLIAIFSDGADDDLDGYADDIAGWDFVDDDNDPNGGPSLDALRAVAAANNGIGGAGVCPSCTILPLRTGLEGRTGSRRLAVAIAFAVDAGAEVIASSLAAPDQDDFLRDATDYAYDRGVPIVASAGTGSSVAPPVAWPPDRVLLVGGLRHDRTDVRRARTALAPDPCSGFGPRVALSAPTRCDDAGAGLAAGVLGLIRSAERGVSRLDVPPLDRALDAAEIMMLVSSHADDAFESGWDQRTGYGRIDARAALDAVVRRRIPVPLQLIAPGWFEVLDPTGKPTLLVRGSISNRRYPRATWELAYAVGIDPEDGDFVSLGTGTVGEGEDGSIVGAIPTTGLLEDPARAPVEKDAHAVTLRLRSSALSGGDVITGEVRRVVFVQRDLEVFPSFPLGLGARATSPRIADVDGDGSPEISIATSQGILHSIAPRGDTRRGWPRRGPEWSFVALHASAPAFANGALPLDVREPILATPAVEPGAIVALTTEGSVLAYDPSGELLPGFPVEIERGNDPVGLTASPALADLDADGRSEIVIAGAAGELHAFTLSGTRAPGFPLHLGEPIGAPAIGDVDGDGAIDLSVAGTSRLFLLKADGKPHTGWPIAAAARAGSVALADADGGDDLEIVLAVRGEPIAIYKADGSMVLKAVSARELGADADASRLGASIVATGEPSIADFDADGTLDAFAFALPENAIVGLAPEDEVERLAGVWSLSTGAFAAAYPRRTDDPSPASAVAADVDGDHRPELITGDGRYRLVAFTVNGRNPSHWPKLTGGTADGSPAAGDLDGDGNLDLVAATREGALFAWRTQSSVEGIAWEGFGHDNRSTRNASAPISVNAAVEREGGCSCSAVHRAGLSSFWTRAWRSALRAFAAP